MKLAPILRDGVNRAIVANAGSLIGTQLVTSGLGFLFWLVAARWFSPAAVGLAAAAISAMTLLGTLGMLGLGTLLMGELPRRGHSRGPLISTALLTAGLVGGCLGLLFSLIAPRLSHQLGPQFAGVQSGALFTLGVGLSAISLVLDSVLVGLLRGHLQLGRNAVFALAKLGALLAVGLWLGDSMGLAILMTWVVGNLLSLAVIGGLLLRDGDPAAYRPQLRLLRGLAGPALAHHLLNLAIQFPGLVLPVLVTILLSARTNSAFYVAWNVLAFLFVVPSALTSVLYAVGSASPAASGRRVRFSLAVSLLLGLLASSIIVASADSVLRLFGHSYAEQATWTLRILALAVFPTIVKTHYIAICRIHRRLVAGALLLIVGGVLELLFASLGATRGGLAGLALGWLAAVCLEAVVMAPAVYRAAVPSDPVRLGEFIVNWPRGHRQWKEIAIEHRA
jgi:O-antigen/teichoic acid export membrane protein